MAVALKRVLGWLIFALMAAALVFAFWNKQTIADHFRASNFEPASSVSELMDNLALTSTGERVFLASRPTIDGSQYFNEQCSQVDHAEDGHVLGCFVDEKIHLFGVADERLGEVVQVTAAHELMHAAYSRMRAGEREALANRLNDYYEEIADDDDQLRERMEVYSHLSSAAFANELHSVFGTEVRELPEWLEDHYSKWFTDRAVVVDGFLSYQQVFEQLVTRADELHSELITLRESYEARLSHYESDVESFNSSSRDLQARNEAYEFSSNPEEFYRIRDKLEALRLELNTELQSLQDDAAKYEKLRGDLKELTETSSELDRQLDSELAPPATRPTP